MGCFSFYFYLADCDYDMAFGSSVLLASIKGTQSIVRSDENPKYLRASAMMLARPAETGTTDIETTTKIMTERRKERQKQRYL